MSAHEAAVRAMAAAPCVVFPDSDAWRYGPGLGSCSFTKAKHPECALTALAASPDVRAALQDALRHRFDGSTTTGLVDAVLGALGMGDDGGGASA